MKLAIISVTNSGALLGDRLADKLRSHGNQIDIFAKQGRSPLRGTTYELLSTLIADIFPRYEGLIFIMATGIVVRVIAPFIQDKRIDPAIVVMDEKGCYAISLLSGHIGGANELAELIGQSIGAQPVITTATDVIKKPAVDVLAVKLNLSLHPFAQLKHMNARIVNGERVSFFLDKALPNQEYYLKIARNIGITLQDLDQINATHYDAAVMITEQVLPLHKPHLYLRQVALAVGIGCRRGATSSEILASVTEACHSIGYNINRITVIGSTVVKQDEVGLLDVIQQLAVPSKFFINEELQECIDKYQLEVSSFVQKQIGVGNICAAAAILAGQSNKLLLPKTKYKNVTVAIAPVKSQLLE